MNTVQPHNVRTVDTTVGELEPGTIFRTLMSSLWKMRRVEGAQRATYVDSGVHCHDTDDMPVVEIADSITIGLGATMPDQLTKAVEIVRELHAWVYAAFDETVASEELRPEMRYDGKRLRIYIGPMVVFDSETDDESELTTDACKDCVTRLMNNLKILVQTDG